MNIFDAVFESVFGPDPCFFSQKKSDLDPSMDQPRPMAIDPMPGLARIAKNLADADKAKRKYYEVDRRIGVYHNPSSAVLDAMTIPSKIDTQCHSCGAAIGKSWKCDYCHVPYRNLPTLYGRPISWDEHVRLVKTGEQPDMDDLNSRTFVAYENIGMKTGWGPI